MPVLVRLLEVSVLAIEPMRWRWCVSHGEIELADGYEDSREGAQSRGDTTLFGLLSNPRRQRRGQ
jgi:hypothetical protein